MRLAAVSILAMSAACASLIPVIDGSAASTDDTTPVFRRVDDPSRLNGVWRSRGYGWLIEIEDDTAWLYDESPSLCVASGSDEDVEDLGGRLEISGDGTSLRLPIHDPAYLHIFDRIGALPAACDRDPDAAPLAVFDAVVELFSTHYPFFGDRKIEWPSLAKASRKRLAPNASETRLLEVVGDLIAKVGDAHVSLEAEKNGRWVVHETGKGKTLQQVAAQAADRGISVKQMRSRWENRYWDHDVADILLDGDETTGANDEIAYGLIDGDIGYIAIRSLEGYTNRDSGPEGDIAALNRVMQRAMFAFRNARAVIVDISINDGGYDTVARALAGRFAAERTLGYYKYAGDAGTETPQAIYVEPSAGRRFTGPVYLITSNVSVSAAEIFTMSMKALPNVTHVGEATRGALSDVLSKPLPNGWSLNLSNEVYLDAKGRRWEGAGIPPDFAMKIFSDEDITVGHVEAVQAVIKAIRRAGPFDLSSR